MARHVKKDDVFRLARALGVQRIRRDSVVRLFLRCVAAAERSAALARELAPAALDEAGGDREPDQAAQEAARQECRHKFVDSNNCAHCGISVEELRQAHRAELARYAEEDRRRGAYAAAEHAGC